MLEEFYQMAVAHDYVVKGGVDYARKILVNAFGPESAKRMLDRLMKSLGNETLSFDALQKTDPQQLAKFIHSEHPQTIALILSHLNPSQAAGLLFSLPAGNPRRCGAAHGVARSDFAGDYFEDRGGDRVEAEIASAS